MQASNKRDSPVKANRYDNTVNLKHRLLCPFSIPAHVAIAAAHRISFPRLLNSNNSHEAVPSLTQRIQSTEITFTRLFS